MLLVELVDDKSRAQFRFKPCSLRRHDIAGIGNVDDLTHGNWIKSQGHLHLAAVDTLLELAKTTDATNEVDALVGAQVHDAEDVAQDVVGRNLHVEHANRIIIVVGAFLSSE